jgi:hypothetical protein
MLSIKAFIFVVMDIRVHYFIDNRSLARLQAGTIKATECRADILMSPLTVTGCAGCVHGRVIMIDSLHHELYFLNGAVWV